LPPLRFTASVKPTNPLSLLHSTTEPISESSSIFSLLSDRNFLGMDEKFAILWAGWTPRPCGISVPQLQPFTSPSWLATTLPISDTPRSPNALPLSLRSQVGNSQLMRVNSHHVCLLQANPTFPTFIDALALHLLPLSSYSVCKAIYPVWLSFLSLRRTKPPVLLVTFPVFSYREFPQKVATPTPA
jgi:hypothetical protein